MEKLFVGCKSYERSRCELAKVKVKLANNAKTETKRIKYNVDKLKNLIDKDIFQLELSKRFNALYWDSGRIKN